MSAIVIYQSGIMSCSKLDIEQIILLDEAQGGQVVAAKLESQVAMLAAKQVSWSSHQSRLGYMVHFLHVGSAKCWVQSIFLASFS